MNEPVTIHLHKKTTTIIYDHHTISKYAYIYILYYAMIAAETDTKRSAIALEEINMYEYSKISDRSMLITLMS